MNDLLERAKKMSHELREYKTSYSDRSTQFQYTPSICVTAADLIDRLAHNLTVALDYAEARLRRKNMYKERSEKHLIEMIALRLELKKIQAERDAAIRDMTRIVFDWGESACQFCGADKPDGCHGCRVHNERFVWRGMQNEQTKDDQAGATVHFPEST